MCREGGGKTSSCVSFHSLPGMQGCRREGGMEVGEMSSFDMCVFRGAGRDSEAGSF